MSIFLHRAKFSNQILPQEKCVIRNNFDVFSELSLLKCDFGVKILKTISHWANFCMESLKREHKSFQKGLIWQKCMLFQTFYTNLQTVLQGLIPKIPD